jgi:ethanolamine utilization protein EutN
MRLGKVVGQVVATAKDPSIAGYTLLIVAPLLGPDPGGEEPFVAIDLIGAGRDEVVLCVQGSGARVAENAAAVAVDAAAIAIADSVILGNDLVYSK